MSLNKRKKQYTKEFKADSVKLLRSSGKTVTELAEELGIERSILARWNREFDKKNAFPGNGNPRDKELFELKREIAVLKEERDILKKAMAIFSQQK